MFNIKEIYCKLYHIIDHQNSKLLEKRKPKRFWNLFQHFIFRGIFSDFYTKKIKHLWNFVQFYKPSDTTKLIVNLLQNTYERLYFLLAYKWVLETDISVATIFNIFSQFSSKSFHLFFSDSFPHRKLILVLLHESLIWML